MSKSEINIERVLLTCFILNLISFIMVILLLSQFLFVFGFGLIIWNGTLILTCLIISDKDRIEKEDVINRFFNISELISITVIIINIIPYPWIFNQPIQYLFIYLIPSFISYILIIYLLISKKKFKKNLCI